MGLVLPVRRFPPPWSVEELDACFAYVYFEDEPGRRSAACRALIFHLAAG